MFKFYKIFLLILIMYSSYTKADEIKENSNIIVIQKISSDKKSFVIRRGQEEKIYPGQRSLFSTRNVSFVAKVITANNQFSQWELLDKNAIVPFSMGEIVTISYSVERVWSEIPKLIADDNYKKMVAEERAKIEKKYVRVVEDRYQLLAGITKSVNESTSGSINNEGNRNGTIFKAKFLPSINENFRWELGVRYDQDTLSLFLPALDITSTRYYGLVGIHTRFTDFTAIDAIPYISINLGFGKSRSQLNDSVRTGSSTILPSLTLGLDFAITYNTSFMLELTMESINIDEQFPTGEIQTTNLTNAMLSIGLEFK